MQNSGYGEPTVTFESVCERKRGGRCFLLLRAKINGAEKHLIYASNGAQEDFCTLELGEDDCRRLFDAVCGCEASPAHLCELAEDARKNQYA